MLTSYHVVRNILADTPQARARTASTSPSTCRARSSTVEGPHGRQPAAHRRGAAASSRRPQAAVRRQRASRDHGADRVSVWDPIYAVGCPLGNDPIPTQGEISSLSNELNGSNYWMINAPTYFGNSGGGVYLADTPRADRRVLQDLHARQGQPGGGAAHGPVHADHRRSTSGWSRKSSTTCCTSEQVHARRPQPTWPRRRRRRRARRPAAAQALELARRSAHAAPCRRRRAAERLLQHLPGRVAAREAAAGSATSAPRAAAARPAVASAPRSISSSARLRVAARVEQPRHLVQHVGLVRVDAQRLVEQVEGLVVLAERGAWPRPSRTAPARTPAAGRGTAANSSRQARGLRPRSACVDGAWRSGGSKSVTASCSSARTPWSRTRGSSTVASQAADQFARAPRARRPQAHEAQPEVDAVLAVEQVAQRQQRRVELRAAPRRPPGARAGTAAARQRRARGRPIRRCGRCARAAATGRAARCSQASSSRSSAKPSRARWAKKSGWPSTSMPVLPQLARRLGRRRGWRTGCRGSRGRAAAADRGAWRARSQAMARWSSPSSLSCSATATQPSPSDGESRDSSGRGSAAGRPSGRAGCSSSAIAMVACATRSARPNCGSSTSASANGCISAARSSGTSMSRSPLSSMALSSPSQEQQEGAAVVGQQRRAAARGSGSSSMRARRRTSRQQPRQRICERAARRRACCCPRSPSSSTKKQWNSTRSPSATGTHLAGDHGAHVSPSAAAGRTPPRRRAALSNSTQVTGPSSGGDCTSSIAGRPVLALVEHLVHEVGDAPRQDAGVDRRRSRPGSDTASGRNITSGIARECHRIRAATEVTPGEHVHVQVEHGLAGARAVVDRRRGSRPRRRPAARATSPAANSRCPSIALSAGSASPRRRDRLLGDHQEVRRRLRPAMSRKARQCSSSWSTSAGISCREDAGEDVLVVVGQRRSGRA